jgi:hypothetical protein
MRHHILQYSIAERVVPTGTSFPVLSILLLEHAPDIAGLLLLNTHH